MNIAWLNGLNARSQKAAFKRNKRVEFYRALYLYQRAGAHKLPALKKLAESYGTHLTIRQRLGNLIFRQLGLKRQLFLPVTARVAEVGALRSNVPLADALRDWLPAAEREILATGEASGDLAGACEMAIRFSQQQGGTWAKAIQALAQPLVLVTAIIGMLYYIGGTFMPTMQVTNTDRFSSMAQTVLGLATWVYQYWPVAVAIPVISIIGVMASLSRWSGSWRVKADRFPPWSFYRRVHGALFLYSFAVLRKSGIPSMAALGNLSATANPWLKTRIAGAMYGTREGHNLGESLRRAGHEFPDWEAIPVLESISSLSGSSEGLMTYAEDWLQDTRAYIERFVRRVESVSMLLIMISVAVLGLTIFEVISNSFR